MRIDFNFDVFTMSQKKLNHTSDDWLHIEKYESWLIIYKILYLQKLSTIDASFPYPVYYQSIIYYPVYYQ